MADVEPLARANAEYAFDLREDLHLAARQVCTEETLGVGLKLKPIPCSGLEKIDPKDLTPRDIRKALAEGQEKCPEVSSIVRKLKR